MILQLGLTDIATIGITTAGVLTPIAILVINYLIRLEHRLTVIETLLTQRHVRDKEAE